MKYFWLIFSFFIFVLAVSPCCEENKVTESNEATIFIANEQDHNSHQHDACSPFCTCANCGCNGCNFDVFQSIYINSFEEPYTVYNVSLYSSEFSSKFEVSIWQPPRLS